MFDPSFRLINAARDAKETDDFGLATWLGLRSSGQISLWRRGTKPMSMTRALELCRLAGFDDPAPWFVALHHQYAKSDAERDAWASIADRIGVTC